MLKYFLGTKFLVGGSYSLEKGHHDLKYEITPASWYWYLLYHRKVPTIRIKWAGDKGIKLSYNNRFWVFYWKPVCDGWFDENHVWHKSKQLQFLTFKLGSVEPNKQKGKKMNETLELHPELADIVNGEGQEAPQEATIFVAEGDNDHAIAPAA